MVTKDETEDRLLNVTDPPTEDEGFKTMEASPEFKWKLAPMPEMDQKTDALWNQGVIDFLKSSDWEKYRLILPDRSEAKSDPNPFSWPKFLLEYYEESIRDRLELIQFVNTESGFYQGLRENHPNDREVVETCREILFENAKLVSRLQGGIENDRAEIKKLKLRGV